MGKSKVLARALGRNKEEEYGDNLHKLTSHCIGEIGLLFTNREKEEVVRYVLTRSLSLKFTKKK